MVIDGFPRREKEGTKGIERVEGSHGQDLASEGDELDPGRRAGI